MSTTFRVIGVGFLRRHFCGLWMHAKQNVPPICRCKLYCVVRFINEQQALLNARFIKEKQAVLHDALYRYWQALLRGTLYD